MNLSKVIRGLALAILFQAVFAKTSAGEEPLAPLRLGMSQTMISTLAPSDAKITLNRIMAMTGLGTTEFITTIFENDAEFMAAVKNEEIDFFPIHAIDVIADENLELMEPVVAPARNGSNPMVRYVLLAHQSNPAKSLADFAGADFHLPKSITRGVDSLWLDVILGEAGLPAPAKFFGEQTDASSAGRAVTAVFFRKADICLTTMSEWETLAELNPQLKMQLRAVAVSEPLLTNVMCFNRRYQNGRRKTVVEEMLKMHESPMGRQLLTITRTDRMVAFQPGNFDTLISLRERHRKLAPAAGPVAPAAAADRARLSISPDPDDE